MFCGYYFKKFESYQYKQLFLTEKLFLKAAFFNIFYKHNQQLEKSSPFFPDLNTMSSTVLETATFTGPSLVSGIGSDLMNGFNLPSCNNTNDVS